MIPSDNSPRAALLTTGQRPWPTPGTASLRTPRRGYQIAPGNASRRVDASGLPVFPAGPGGKSHGCGSVQRGCGPAI